MEARVSELQQVIFKKDLMILALQKRVDAYHTQFGSLDATVLEALEAEEKDIMDRITININNTTRVGETSERRRLSSNASEALLLECSSQSLSSSSAVASRNSTSGITSSEASTDTLIVPPSPSRSAPPPPTAPNPPPSSTISATGVISTIGKNITLDYVEDSPMFRRQLEGFEESMSGLRGLLKEILARTKEFVAAGMKYGEEETALAEEIVNRKYARALFTTSCPALGSLSSMLNEVHDTITQIQSSRMSMLLSIEALLHHSIYRFVEHELKEANELRKEVVRLADEYESQLGKLLGKSRGSGSSGSGSGNSMLTVSDPSHILGGNNGAGNTGGGSRTLEREVMQARLRFELARFDLVRYLNRLDAQKKFVLMECFNSTLYAFLSHFHTCHELIKSIENGLRNRQSVIQQAKRDHEEDEKMWTSQREALEARLKMDADGDIRGTGTSLELPIEVVSGDTMIGRESMLAGSGGGIVKQGYLFVRNSMFPTRSWKRRWFQIHSGKLYQNKTKHLDLTLVCDLMLSRVREATSTNLPYCFEIIDAAQSKHLLQTTSEVDLHDWIEAARKSTESMLEKQQHRMVVHPEQQQCIEELINRNPACADCGQVPSEWVSINIGCFLCIECSGIHRSLGVHVSKVRSLTLDSWEMGLLTILRDHLGNEVVNSVWEASIPPGWNKPTPSSTSSRDDKTKWIKAKYHFHGLAEFSELQPHELVQRWLKGADTKQIQELMWCLAHGIDVNAKDGLTGETALHRAASQGWTAGCEYLVLNGASLVLADTSGRLPYDAAKVNGHEAVKLTLMQKMSLEQYQF